MGQRVIEFALEKKDVEGPYWTRLVKDAKKQHWLKVDFSKWRDEDESDEEAGGGEGLEQVSLFLNLYYGPINLLTSLEKELLIVIYLTLFYSLLINFKQIEFLS